MPCLKCGATETIKSHLIPRCFATQVQPGKSHALVPSNASGFKQTQSGLWDNRILCASCDNALGELENYLLKVTNSLRENGSDDIGRVKVVVGADPAVVMRALAGLLYKYSVTTKERGKIELGRYQDTCRDFAFGERSRPDEFDAFAFRLMLRPGDNRVFAYRAPISDRQHGVNVYRILLGGVLFFVKLDRRPMGDPNVAELLMASADELRVVNLPAQMFEEFRLAKAAINKNERLSQFLDKHQ